MPHLFGALTIRGRETVTQFANYLTQPIPVGEQHPVVAVEAAVSDRKSEPHRSKPERGDRESDRSRDHEPNRTESRTL